MAEKALQKVEDELNCSICLDACTKPKILTCFHFYCQDCLARLAARAKGELTCPDCRQVTPIPDGGVANLKPAFHINKLQEIMEEHKKSGAENKPTCKEHPGKEYLYYCGPCMKLICSDCITKQGKHHQHSLDDLPEALTKYKNEIASLQRPVEKQFEIINQAQELVDSSQKKIIDQEATIKAEILGSKEQPQESKDQMIAQLKQHAENKLSSLAAQKSQLNRIQAQLETCLDYITKTLEANDDCMVLETKQSVIKQCKELIVPFQPELLKPCKEADLKGKRYSFYAVHLADILRAVQYYNAH